MPFAESWSKIAGQMQVAEIGMRGMVKAGKIGSIEGLVSGGGGPAQFTANYQRQSRARQAYALLRNVVYEATNVIARRAAGQHWMAGHYEDAPPQGQTPDKRRRYSKDLIPKGIQRLRKAYGFTDVKPDAEHSVLWLLDQPNKVQGRFELIYITAMNLLLTGEWYWIGGVNKTGDKAELWAVPSSWMVPDHSKGLYGGYKLQTGFGGEGIPIPRENVCRGYFPDPSDIKACLSPLAMCASPAKIDDYILGSQEGSFERGIFPQIALVVGQSVGPDGRTVNGPRPSLTGPQRRQLVRAVRHVWSQTVSQGDPAILDGLIEDVKKLQMTPQEMDWQRSAEQVKQRIYRTFGVNPYITGEITQGNRAQAVVAEQNFATNVLNPILENISIAATNFFGPFYEDGDTLAVWLEQAVPKDEEREDRQWAQARTAGDVTQEEVRARMGLEPLEQEPKRSPLMNNPQTLLVVSQIAEKVSAGAMSRDNAIAQLMVMLQISKEDAERMMPEDPPEPTPEELAAQALAQGGQPGPAGGPPAGPAAGGGQKPPAKPAAKPKPKPEEEPEKAFDPSQPRDDAGRWTGGGDSMAPDRGDGSGAQGTSPREGDPEPAADTSSGRRQVVDFDEDPWKFARYRNAPDLRRDIVDMKRVKEIRAELKAQGRLNDDGRTVSVYHATVADADQILEQGLVPAASEASGQEWKAEHSDYATYFHSSRELAERDIEYGGTVIEARIPVTPKSLIRFLPDEDMDSDIHNGVKTLLEGGAVAYIGGVPASALKVVATNSGDPPPAKEFISLTKSPATKMARTLVKAAHQQQVERVQRQAARKLAKYFQKSVRHITSRLFAKSWEPDPEKAKSQAARLIKGAYDKDAQGDMLVDSASQPVADAFVEGAAAEMRLNAAARRRKAFDPSQPRDESGRWAGGGATFFHGTLAESVDSILADGIKVGEANYSETKAGHVYVADSEHEALYWARETAFKSGKGDKRDVALLEVRIPASARRRVSDDENVAAEQGSFKFKGTIKPEWIVSAKVGTLERYSPLALQNERKVKSFDSEGDETIWVAVAIPPVDEPDDERAFNPDQPRNPDGTWGSGGASKWTENDAANSGFSISELPAVEQYAKPATKADLQKDEISLWHGTSYSGAAGIATDNELTGGGPRGNNATAYPGHASQYPEDTGADVLVLLRAKTAELTVDPNDQIGETVEEGLFPKNMAHSSVSIGGHRIVAMFDLSAADSPDDAIESLNSGNLRAAIKAGLRKWSVDAKRVLPSIKVTTATEAAERAEEEIDFPTKLPDWLREAAQDFVLETFEEDYWLRIPQVTRDDIELTLWQAIEDGLSIRDIAEQIQERHGTQYSRARAANVARTEMTGAMNAGHEEGIRQAFEGMDGIAPAKEWLSVMGTTTRDTHADADGQQVPLDEQFTVGGHQCMYPGDAALPPEERCNCQCTIVSAFVGEGLVDNVDE